MRLIQGDSPQSIQKIVCTSDWSWFPKSPSVERIVLDELSRLIEFVCLEKDQDYMTAHMFDSCHPLDDMTISINFIFEDLWFDASLKTLLDEYREGLISCFEDIGGEAAGTRWHVETEMQASATSHVKFLRAEADKIEATLKTCEPTSKSAGR